MSKPINLRGRGVTFVYDGRSLTGVVVTRTRGTRWLIESMGLPKDCERYRGCRRVTLDRRQFTVSALKQPQPIRKARTAVEILIDRACGLNE